MRDDERRLPRDKERIRERWVRFFRSLLNAKSHMPYFFLFFFSCSAHYERDWPPCKVVLFGLATNALNVRYNNNNNNMLDPCIPKGLLQQPVPSSLSIEPSEDDIATAIKAMVDAKKWGRTASPRNC